MEPGPDRTGTARVGVDVGGTFTDVGVVDGGRMWVAKVPSTPADQSAGVMAALAKVPVAPGDAEVISHGTTVATNALLERGKARTALLTTDGFRRPHRSRPPSAPSLYDLSLQALAPLVPRELRFTVREPRRPGRRAGDATEDSDIALRVSVTVKGDGIKMDFAGTSGPVAGNVNCPRSVTLSACLFALRVALGQEIVTRDRGDAQVPRRGGAARRPRLRGNEPAPTGGGRATNAAPGR